MERKWAMAELLCGFLSQAPLECSAGRLAETSERHRRGFGGLGARHEVDFGGEGEGG